MKKYAVVRPSGNVKYGFLSEGAADQWIRQNAKHQGLDVVSKTDNASTPFVDYLLSNDDVYSIRFPTL
jgi:hypothetical protein